MLMMNPYSRFFALTCLTLTLAGCGQSVWNTVSFRTGPLENDREKISYAMGETIGADWKNSKTDFDCLAAARGMDEALAGRLSPSSLKDAENTLTNFKNEHPVAVSADERSRASYAMGVNLGSVWKVMHMDLDASSVGRGIHDFLAGDDHLMTLDDARKWVAQYGQEMAARQADERQKLAEKNRMEGDAFLRQNQAKEGVVTLPSGLQYKILREGSGSPPDPQGWVTVKFRGTLLDGTEIDNSDRYGQPCTLGLGSIIAGWSEALQLMKPGAEWEIYIPADLAYGSQGGLKVGPNATLVYTFELLSVLPDRPQPTREEIVEMNKN